jgi:lysophospholipase L1-like esterase
LLVVAALCLACVRADAQEPAQPTGIERWEADIRKFEEQDKLAPPKPGGVLFIGSSSIRRWQLDESFPDRGYINRGFGGSQIADSTHFADRIVIPYKPRLVVLYAGDNDLAKGKSPEQVAADFAAFAAKVHAALPETRIAFIGIKPSIARWAIVDKVRAANRRIASACEKHERLRFVDVDQPTLGDDGKPRGELFVKDGLHLSAAGYELWTKLLTPALE